MFMDLLLLSFAGVTAKEYLSLLNKSWISPELKKKINYAGTLDRKKIIASLDRNNIGYLTHEHGLYPALLKEIYDFPYILYYRGERCSFKGRDARGRREQKSDRLYQKISRTPLAVFKKHCYYIRTCLRSG